MRTQIQPRPTPEIEDWTKTLSRAHNECTRQGRERWVALHRPLASQFVDHVLNTPEWADADAIWREPGLTFAATGSVGELVSNDAERFQKAADWLRRVRGSTTLSSSAPQDLPLAFGGFAFDHEDRQSPWDEWDALKLSIPETIVYVRRGRGGIVRILSSDKLKELLQSGRKPAEVATRVQRELDRWLARAAHAKPLESSLSSQAPPTPRAVRRGDFISTVERAKRDIQNTQLDKVVVSRRCELRPAPGHTFHIPRIGAELKNAVAFGSAFMLRGNDGSVFCGATPETLVRVDRSTVITHAVAGTIGRSEGDDDATLTNALIESAKDQHEHQLVVHHITSALGTAGANDVRWGAQHVLKLPHVQHLVTPIRSTLPPELTIMDVAQRLHPTPAVGGWPVAEAKQWIRQHEGYDRGWYAGGVGWFAANGDGHIAVAIRSALVTRQAAHTFAGAGIVPGSDADKEFVETEIKLMTFTDALVSQPDIQPGATELGVTELGLAGHDVAGHDVAKQMEQTVA